MIASALIEAAIVVTVIAGFIATFIAFWTQLERWLEEARRERL